MNYRNQALFDHGENFYGKVLLNPTTFAQVATSPEIWADIMSFHHQLATDPYVQYVDAYCREGVKRFGGKFWYLDIVNTLYTASKLTQPKRYLEIGVRRGRSVCTVARACPSVEIFAFDMWIQNYANMENPGPEFVRNELLKHGHTGNINFINGNSHETLPAFFKQNPKAEFDLITVDGDHTEEGAYKDLCDVIPHLAVGGMLVFDDISHPAHPYLLSVWKKAIEKFPFLVSGEYGENGYGVGFAIRRS